MSKWYVFSLEGEILQRRLFQPGICDMVFAIKYNIQAGLPFKFPWKLNEWRAKIMILKCAGSKSLIKIIDRSYL